MEVWPWFGAFDRQKGRSFADFIWTSLFPIAGAILAIWRMQVISQDEFDRIFHTAKGNKRLFTGSFVVLTAICDSFLPRLNANELDERRILRALGPLCTCDESSDFFQALRNLNSEQKMFLQRGALDMKLHELLSDAIETKLLIEDRRKLLILLRILGTTVGCFILTGYPAPFQVPTYFVMIISLGQRKLTGFIAF
jgi:hypothetical protein